MVDIHFNELLWNYELIFTKINFHWKSENFIVRKFGAIRYISYYYEDTCDVVLAVIHTYLLSDFTNQLTTITCCMSGSKCNKTPSVRNLIITTLPAQFATHAHYYNNLILTV